jgi:CheW-like domain
MNLDDKNSNRERETLAHKKLQAITASSKADEPLVLMDCGELSLLVSSKDIVTLMPAQKMLPSNVAQACGALELEQQHISVFAFNKALQLQTDLLSNQLTLVVLQQLSHKFAIACCSLEKLETPDLHFFSVPISMSSRKQPFTQFAVLNNRAAGLVSAASLWRLLQLRGVSFPAVAVHTPKRIQEAG